jgi:divalent metal cation (Fe/Co/Zn/Cd) transporter
VFTVLFEDSAALLGLLTALIGLAASEAFDVEWPDGAASVVIGIILAVAAVTLARETKSLLTGETAGRLVLDGIREILGSVPEVRGVNELRAIHLGPQDILLALGIALRDGLDTDGVEATIRTVERRIQERFPQIRQIFTEVQDRAASPSASAKAPAIAPGRA